MSLRILTLLILALGVFLLTWPVAVGYAQNENMIEFVSPEDLMRSDSAVALPSHEKPVILHDNRDVDYKPASKMSEKVITPAGVITKEKSPQPVMLKQPKASYKLGSGDKVKITVFGEEDLSGTYLVNEEGYIFMPLIGEISAQGLTIENVSNDIRNKLLDGYLKDPSIALEIASFRPIYVMGEVREPGSYNFVTDMSIRNAVAIAGGFTYRANQKKIEILRETAQDETVRYEDLAPDQKIEPGDIIIIKERFF